MIAVDSNDKLIIFSLEKKCLCTDLINLNINPSCIYIPNIYSKGFENNLIFFGALNGDIFIFDLIEFKFAQFNLSFKSVRNYLIENKIKLKNIPLNDSPIEIRLDNTDYNRLYIVYKSIGLFILNIQVKLHYN